MIADRAWRDLGCPDFASFDYASAYLRSPDRFERKKRRPLAPFWYREPGLWVPLSCAIAYDTGVDASYVVGATSQTWSHTCTGSDRLLAVGVFGELVSLDGTGVFITGATYNGVAMTLVFKQAEAQGNTPGSDRWVYLFLLVNPASGANNVVVSGSTPMVMGGMSTSYTGAKATGQPEQAFRNWTAAPGAEVTCTLSAITSCWLVMVAKNNVSVPSAGTATTARVTSADAMGLFDSNGLVSGTAALQATGPAADWAGIMMSILPAASAATTKTLAALGVG